VCETTNHSGTSHDITEVLLNRQEFKLIEVLRKLDYGEIRVVMKASEIVQIEEKRSIKVPRERQE